MPTYFKPYQVVKHLGRQGGMVLTSCYYKNIIKEIVFPKLHLCESKTSRVWHCSLNSTSTWNISKFMPTYVKSYQSLIPNSSKTRVCKNFERCSNFKIKTSGGEDTLAEHKNIRAGNFSYLWDLLWSFFVTYIDDMVTKNFIMIQLS